MNISNFWRSLLASLIALLLVQAVGAQQAAPRIQTSGAGASLAITTGDAQPLTRAISVRLGKSSVLMGEPIELVLVMNAKQSYRDKWPDFLGGQAHVKVQLVDGAGKKSPFFWIDQGSMYGALRPRDITEPIPILRARRDEIENTVEVHLWLGEEQLPLVGEGNYQIVVVSSRGANPTPPWYGPGGQQTSPENLHRNWSKDDALDEPTLAKQKVAEVETTKISDAPSAPMVTLPLSVKNDGKEITKIAEALQRVITNDGMRGVSRHEAEIQALFSLSGPEARHVQESLMSEVGDDPWGAAPIYQALSRLGTPRAIDFIADQHWNKGRRPGVNNLLVMHYFGTPEMRRQIQKIFRKHGEPIRAPIYNW